MGPAGVVRAKAPPPAMRKVVAEMLRSFAAASRGDADSFDPETAATCRSEAQQTDLAAMKLEQRRQAWENTGMVPVLLVKRSRPKQKPRGSSWGKLNRGCFEPRFSSREQFSKRLTPKSAHLCG